MKKVNYSGSSKVIIRLCQAVNDLIDRGGGGHTIQNSSGTDMTARTNLQFTGATVSDDAVNDRTVVAISGGGHTIQDADGTDLTQRDNLQFVDAHLSDDAVNDSTVVEIVDETTEASFDLIDETDADNDGIYVFEGNGTALDASQVSYGNETVEDALDDVVRASTGGTFNGNVTVDTENGTTVTVGNSVVFLGNNKGSGTNKNSKGTLALYSSGTNFVSVTADDNLTANRFVVFPDKDGFVALDSDCLKVNKMSATSSALTAYAYSIGGYFGEVYFSNMSGYDASLTSRTKFYVVTSCYLSSNASVNGIATIRGSQDRVLINGNGAYTYYVEVAQIYV